MKMWSRIRVYATHVVTVEGMAVRGTVTKDSDIITSFKGMFE